MKKFYWMALFAALLLGLIFPTVAHAGPPSAPRFEDRVVFGGSFTLPSGEVLDGNLVSFGGVVHIQAGSRVNGDVVAFGGSISVEGEIQGNLVALGAVLSLGETAVVEGDLITPGSEVQSASGVVVEGQVITESGPFDFSVPSADTFDFNLPSALRPQNFLSTGFARLTDLWWFLLRIFAISALAVLVTVFLPEHTKRIATATVQQPVPSAGLGLLTLLVLAPLSILLAITIILIPFTLLSLILLGVAVAWGWVALGTELGHRLADAFHQDWPPVLAAGAGTFTLSLVFGMVGWIPCIGWLVGLIGVSLGLGGVILTRFGTQEYLKPVAPVVADSPEE